MSFDHIFNIYNRPRNAAINDATLDLGIRTEYANNSVYLTFYRQTVMRQIQQIVLSWQQIQVSYQHD